MRDRMFRSRVGRDSGLQTIDTVGTTPCASEDKKVREGAHCSSFGKNATKGAAKKTATAKTTKQASAKSKAAPTSKARAASKVSGAQAAVAYDNTIGGENDLPPVGKMKTTAKKTAAKPATAKKATSATAKKSTGATAKKSTAKTTAAKKPAGKNDDYILVEEVIIVEEYI